MIVEIAIQHEGIRGCKGSTGTYKRVSLLAALAKLIPKGTLIAQTEETVHLFAIHARRKLAQLSKRPASRVVGVIAFIQLESSDADVDQVFTVIVAKDAPCLGILKVRHKTTPYALVSREVAHRLKKRRRRMNESVLP